MSSTTNNLHCKKRLPRKTNVYIEELPEVLDEKTFKYLMRQLKREYWYNGCLWQSANIAEHIDVKLTIYNVALSQGNSEGWIKE